MERHYQSIAAIYGAETGLPVFLYTMVRLWNLDCTL